MADPQKALDRALDEENIVPVYQPIHELESRRVWGVEALLRQRRDSGELREAKIITKAAENAPQEELSALGSAMMRMAFDDAARWNGIHLHVNVSPREFEEEHFLDRLNALISGCGIDRTHVNLELTEMSYIKHPDDIGRVLEQVKELGIGLWLDDFGTRHSTLEHLQHFPADGIKIAAEYIKDADRGHTIAAALIGLAHDLGMRVIAEGVEHDEQLALLREHGCDFVQGFLFSRPMQCDALERFLGQARPGSRDRGGAPDPRERSA